MKVFVTGGYGFLGAHVLRQLVRDGHDVCSFDIATETAVELAPDIVDIKGDVTDPVDVYDAMSSFGPDRVIHLVSVLSETCENDPRFGFDVNVNGTLHVLEAASTLDVDRVIAASSVAIYGSVPDEYDHLDETVRQDPDSVYGLTKYNIERLGDVFAGQSNFSFAALQPVYTTGPDRRTGYRPFASILKAAVSGTPITIPESTKPLEVNYVTDVARAFVHVALAPDIDHSTYLVGSGHQTSLVELVELVEERVSDADITIGDPQEEDFVPSLPPSRTGRLRTEFDWRGRPIEAAVDGYAEWLETNEDKWEFDPETDRIS